MIGHPTNHNKRIRNSQSPHDDIISFGSKLLLDEKSSMLLKSKQTQNSDEATVLNSSLQSTDRNLYKHQSVDYPNEYNMSTNDNLINKLGSTRTSIAN